jgi:outer membrane immunogenic protein
MRTKKLLASTALSTSAVLASGAAFAQAPAFNWTGFYIGLNAGGASSRIEHGLSVPAIDDDPFRRFASNDRDRSFTGGFLAGYNWQFTNWLLGIEADINYLRAAHQTNFAFLNTGEDVVGTQNTRLRSLGTVRGRLGYTWANTLVYATGGWAFGSVRSNVDAYRFFGAGPDAAFAGSYSSTRNGWTVGGGVEHAFSNWLSLRIEYLHFDLGNFSYVVNRVSGTASTSVPNTWFADGQVSGDIVRAAVIVRLGPPR